MSFNIIARAEELKSTVELFVGHARQYYHDVVLSGYKCPRCGSSLSMTAESRCMCQSCLLDFDPTQEFQKCPDCQSKLLLKICRYQCGQCGQFVQSRFVFDGKVFDSEYFRERMQQSRQKKSRRRKEFARQCLENRSDRLDTDYIDFNRAEGLSQALDNLSEIPELKPFIPLCKGFDLKRYQKHLQPVIGNFRMCFDDLPQLEENARNDRIWRFVTIVYMAHCGEIEIYQEDEIIYVIGKK